MEFIAENKRVDIKRCHLCTRLDLRDCNSCKDGLVCENGNCDSFEPVKKENITARIGRLIEKIGICMGE